MPLKHYFLKKPGWLERGKHSQLIDFTCKCGGEGNDKIIWLLNLNKAPSL